MNLYETTFILNPQVDDATLDRQVKAITDLIGANDGKVVYEDRMGTRRLAYEIQGVTQGYYTSVYFEGAGALPKVLDRHYRLEEPYLRHLTVVFEGDIEVVKGDRTDAIPPEFGGRPLSRDGDSRPDRAGRPTSPAHAARPAPAAKPVKPEESAPAETTPAETKPSETDLDKTAPIAIVPVETAPVETAPVETAPVETAPVETAPVKTAPVETAPVETVPEVDKDQSPSKPESPAAGGDYSEDDEL